MVNFCYLEKCVERVITTLGNTYRGNSLTKSNSDLQRRISKLEKRVIKYRKLDRIDFALLSVSSILGLFFAGVNYIIGNFALFILIPTFIIAWVMPFYINLSTDVSSIKLIEHVRAWIYFFGGLLFYVVATFVIFASSHGFLKDWLVLFIIFALASLWSKIPQINKKLMKIIFGWYGEKVTKRAEEKIYHTLNIAFTEVTFFAGFSLFFYLGYLYIQLYQILSNIEILLGSLYFFITGFVMLIYGLKNLISFEIIIKRR